LSSKEEQDRWKKLVEERLKMLSGDSSRYFQVDWGAPTATSEAFPIPRARSLTFQEVYESVKRSVEEGFYRDVYTYEPSFPPPASVPQRIDKFARYQPARKVITAAEANAGLATLPPLEPS